MLWSAAAVVSVAAARGVGSLNLVAMPAADAATVLGLRSPGERSASVVVTKVPTGAGAGHGSMRKTGPNLLQVITHAPPAVPALPADENTAGVAIGGLDAAAFPALGFPVAELPGQSSGKGYGTPFPVVSDGGGGAGGGGYGVYFPGGGGGSPVGGGGGGLGGTPPVTGPSGPPPVTVPPSTDNPGITPGAPVSAVPELDSWLMMVAGFGMVGGAIRRRKTVLAPLR